jgi:hypothetical protein
VTAGYISCECNVTVPKGEALEILTQCYANELQYSTEDNDTEMQKVTYKDFTKYEVLVLVAMQDVVIQVAPIVPTLSETSNDHALCSMLNHGNTLM